MARDTFHLGILVIALTPQQPCRFTASPARSLRAALLRRLELLDPELTEDLHEAPQGPSANLRPWTVSPLLGPLDRNGEGFIAQPGRVYRVRVGGLVPPVLEALGAAFLSDHPLSQEPLLLERVPFTLVADECRWEGLTAYPYLLTRANPTRRLGLRFHSPTGFRRRENRRVEPEPALCLTGYLRKWNAFANVSLPEEQLLKYAREHLRVVEQDLRPASMKLGRYAIPGVVGRVSWEADGAEPALLRLVNALVEYAGYCGTGIQTTQGMGQTERLGRLPPLWGA